MQCSAPRQRRDALLIRGPSSSRNRWFMGPGSASRHFMPRRVRDTRKSETRKPHRVRHTSRSAGPDPDQNAHASYGWHFNDGL